MDYRVGTLRDAGLEAKWVKNSAGAPIIKARNPKAKAHNRSTKWFYVDAAMWKDMKKMGIMSGWDSWTLLGDVFFI